MHAFAELIPHSNVPVCFQHQAFVVIYYFIARVHKNRNLVIRDIHNGAEVFFTLFKADTLVLPGRIE